VCVNEFGAAADTKAWVEAIRLILRVVCQLRTDRRQASITQAFSEAQLGRTSKQSVLYLFIR
jgi:hypothetical protein